MVYNIERRVIIQYSDVIKVSSEGGVGIDYNNVHVIDNLLVVDKEASEHSIIGDEFYHNGLCQSWA